MEINKKIRYKEEHEDRFDISMPTVEDPTLVVCPKCSKMAKVFPSNEKPKIGYSMRVACTNCGYVKEKTDNVRRYYWHDEDPTDGYFKYPLWLKNSCCGHPLWVFNRHHLEFLEKFVSAELREREQKDKYGWSNGSLMSRLPKWIKSKKNRKKILECLAKLRVMGGLEE